MILSMFANTSIEDVAASVPQETLLFMQLNILVDRKMTENIIKRVIASGRYRALVVTVDQPCSGKIQSRKKKTLPAHLS